MKKFVLVAVLLLSVITSVCAQDNNPVVKRLSAQDLQNLEIPESVAYNFVSCILLKEWDMARSFLAPDYFLQWSYYSDSELEKEFSSPGKLNILGWLPALNGQFEVAVGYVDDVWYYEDDGSLFHSFGQVVKDGMVYLPDEDTPRVGINHKTVYMICVPSHQVGRLGFQDIQRYGDANVKVVLVQVNGQWRVNGFR